MRMLDRDVQVEGGRSPLGYVSTSRQATALNRRVMQVQGSDGRGVGRLMMQRALSAVRLVGIWAIRPQLKQSMTSPRRRRGRSTVVVLCGSVSSVVLA